MKYLGLGLLILLGHAQSHGQGRRAKFLEPAAHGKYQPGWYTLLDGTRHAGRLRLWQTLTRNAVQVDQGKADPINLAPEALRHFTMGTDSFTVAREIAVAGQPTTTPFGEADVYRVVLKGKFQVLEHDRLVSGQYGPGQYGAGQYGGPGQYGAGQYGPAHYRTWVLRPTKEADLVMMPTNNQEFAQYAAAFFVDYPPLAQHIRAGLVGPADFKRIVYSYVFRKEIDQVTYEEAATLFR